jgi:hypothetical protein
VTDITHLNAQKKIELEHLLSFRRACDDFPVGEILSGETPDFIVDTGSTRIGIEHTQVYIDSAKKRGSLQSCEAAKTRIIQLAEQHVQEAALPDVYVSLFFNLTWLPERKQEERIAQAVAQTVIDNLPPEGKSVWVTYQLHSGQPIEVDLIGIHRISDFGDKRWSAQEAGQPVNDAIKRIQGSIDSKEGKLRNCLQKCDEFWLLIVAPSWTPAGMIHPDAASLEHTYSSSFARIYFLNHSYGTVIQLNTKPASV